LGWCLYFWTWPLLKKKCQKNNPVTKSGKKSTVGMCWTFTNSKERYRFPKSKMWTSQKK
jgi:hypothetical protein